MKFSALRRDRRLSTDSLRMWERRYRFPQPMRDADSEPVHPVSQVEKLHSIKRLMDCGQHPGRVISRGVGQPGVACRFDEQRYTGQIRSNLRNASTSIELTARGLRVFDKACLPRGPCLVFGRPISGGKNWGLCRCNTSARLPPT